MIDTRRIASEFRLSAWANIIRERNQSGLSVREWCDVNGINEKRYYHWQRRVREAACEESLANAPSEPIATDSSTTPVGWTMCEVSSQSSTANENILPIEINGCRILASADTDTELLAKTCKVLMSLC